MGDTPKTESSPTAPHTRQMAWAIFRLVFFASTGMANARTNRRMTGAYFRAIDIMTTLSAADSAGPAD